MSIYCNFGEVFSKSFCALCKNICEINILRPNFEKKRAGLFHNKSPDVSACMNFNVENCPNIKIYDPPIGWLCVNGFFPTCLTVLVHAPAAKRPRQGRQV